MNDIERDKIITTTFFDIDKDQYEEYKDIINIICSIGDCIYNAKYATHLGLPEDKVYSDEDITIAAISEATKAKTRFLHSTNYKYSQKDVLLCLKNLQENDMVKNIAKGLRGE